MSQYYEVDGESVWNPATRASELFLAHVRVYEEWVGVPSGFGPMRNDECPIDVPAFEAFANALLDRHNHTGHAIVDALADGFIATVLALAARIGLDVRLPERPATLDGFMAVQVPSSVDPGRAARLRAQVLELQRAMPR
ncbi:DUF6086 family protein [Streptomyces sp. NPDC006872]|uniref:DUF6086 family protein n=1 Tax=Streptomyces sp. NPDC006872 TaxID=3155720 RepID=UPI003409DE2D